MGDAQAIASQGPIAIHRLEHLGHTDRGVTFYRRLLRRGKTPLQPAVACAAPIPTYAGDSVLRIPARPGQDDRELVREVSAKVLEVYRGADHLTGAARDAHIQAQVGELEAAYAR